MKALLTTLALAALMMPALAVATPTTPDAVGPGCFELTSAHGLRTAQVIKGLGLTAEQADEVQRRLAKYPTGFNGLDGIGLTPEQIATINQRIAAQTKEWNAHPLGWPCAPFKHPTRVISWMRAELIYQGFRPSMQFSRPSPRRIQVIAVQDGYEYLGVIAKTGPRQIKISLRNMHGPGGAGWTYNLKFEA